MLIQNVMLRVDQLHCVMVPCNLLLNGVDKVCAFNKFFSSVFSPPNLVPPPINLASAHISDEVDFSPAAVFAALCKAKHYPFCWV